MSSNGSVMRSAKMKLITPPKLMPPRHSAAASGTLPIEHTKLADRDERTDDHVLDRREHAVVLPEHVVPHVRRHEHGEEAGDDVADHAARSAAS